MMVGKKGRNLTGALAAIGLIVIPSCLVDVPVLRQGATETLSDAGVEPEVDAQVDGEFDSQAPACGAGTADCDGKASNGCETSTDVNPYHCGSCFRDCLGGACVAGQCRPAVISSTTTNPYRLAMSAADGTGDLYWTTDSVVGAAVWRATHDLSLVGPLVAEDPDAGVSTILGLAIGQYELFWSERVRGGIHAASLDGEGYRVLTVDAPGTYDLALDASHVYWANDQTKQIARVSHTTGHAEILVTQEENPWFVALSDTHVYWSTRGKQILRALKDGSQVCQIAETQFLPWDLVVDGEWVYWREGTQNNVTEGRVMRASDECSSQDLLELASGQGDPRFLVLHGDFVFFTVNEAGAIRRVSKQGGPVEEVYRTELTNGTYEDVHGLAVDSLALYWSSYGKNKVYRLAR